MAQSSAMNECASALWKPGACVNSISSNRPHGDEKPFSGRMQSAPKLDRARLRSCELVLRVAQSWAGALGTTSEQDTESSANCVLNLGEAQDMPVLPLILGQSHTLLLPVT
jgi:hypothetical protein